MKWLWENKHGYKMSGAVYRPTTVQYESNSPPERRQHRPISYLASISHRATPCVTNLTWRKSLNLALICSCWTLFAIGIFMVMKGSIGYSESSDEVRDTYFVVTLTGAALIGLAFLIFLIYLRIKGQFKREPKDHMGSSSGQNLTVNPSTDLLVTAQYAPVSEVVYERTKCDDPEQSKLMPQGNKEISNEDADRMVENDPRIVLRPLNAAMNEEV
ncbi:uncharacterized protein LOC109545241 isoform X1 [Dendroctonus ponderosae]|uniref:Uncharacterized protein n=1 Tax=Dendroctonus ponderosae TaxID=77166 RepID=A0AAR5QDT9_DENPD|nr:uncharacterized protein LOC109545241 isoform X1 [Dendroctonus ponderosae]